MKQLILFISLFLFFVGCTAQQTDSELQQATDRKTVDEPVYIADSHYRGVPVEIGLQGNEALPVQAILQTEQDLPVTLHMEQGEKLPVQLEMKKNKRLAVQVEGVHSDSLPVEVTTNDKAINVQISTHDEALPVKFGLPPIPQEAIVPLIIAGGGLVLLYLFAFLAAIGAWKAARKIDKIANIYLKQISKENKNQ